MAFGAPCDGLPSPQHGAFFVTTKTKAEYRTKTVLVKIDDDTKTVTARFATFGVVDHDGDIIEAGSVGEQDVFLGAWNHSSDRLPPGKGATSETKKAAMFKGEFFDTTSGLEHYKTIKAAGDTMEWSFRFFVEEGGFETRGGNDYYVIRKMRITHVAPVESGAGINTGTVGIKQHPEAVAPIDYELLATTVATAVVNALGATKGGCGPCAGGKSNKGETLGALLRELRDEKELTNDDLASAAGVSVATVGQMLGGTIVCPSPNRLQGLARRLGVNLSRLVTAAENDGCDLNEDDPQDAATDATPDAKDTVTEPEPDDDTPTSAKDTAADDTTADADADDPEGTDGSDRDPEDADSKASPDIMRQVEALLSGYPGMPKDVDPALAAFERFKQTIGKV